jgi:hypothetical protein
MNRRGISVLIFMVCAWAPGAWAQLAAPNANRPERSPGSSLSRIPVAAQPVISEALGRDGSDFRVRASNHGFHADNPPHGLAADFSRKGLVLRRGSEQWGLKFLGFGYGGALALSNEVDPSSSANRVEYQRGPLTEWYVNGPMGLEQGFTLNEPPGPRNGQPLTIVFEMSGNLRAAVETGSSALALSGRDGVTGIRYAGLSARDAAGREFRARLKVEGERLLLEADDAGALYPVVVDPFIQETTLSTAANAGHVAISGDNNTVAVTSDIGVSIFVDSGSGWNQVALLTAPDFLNTACCDSVALSYDGNTLVCGASGVDSPIASEAGSAFVFVKPGSTWINMLPTAQLYGSDAGLAALFGASVAISDDGSTVLVGAPETLPNSGVGGAYIFLRPSTGWGSPMTESGKLEPSDGVTQGQFGFSVAISGDGHTAAILNQPFMAVGAGYTFFSPLPWPSLITASASLIPDVKAQGFGYSMAMSRDASTVVIGAPDFATGQGAAFVFVKDPILGWHQAALLAASDGVACDNLGFSVSISGDGSHVLAGANYHAATNAGTGSTPCEFATPGGGSVYEFVSHAGNWSTETQDSELGSPFGQGSLFGFSVAISDDTTRLVISANNTFLTDVIDQPLTTTVNWPTPAAITFGTPLSGTQLDATAGVPGMFVYTPPAGTILPAGTQTLSVQFTPTDTAAYTTATATTSIIVNKATPTITWSAPAAITYGTPLSGTQLNATANVLGTFVYTPPVGTVLTAGTHTLSVEFIPTDPADHTIATATTSIIVNKATPTVTWSGPAAISYGTPLSGTQLNATANVLGTFTYTPPAGTILTPGGHDLTVTFVPSDTADYNSVRIGTSIFVNKAILTVAATSFTQPYGTTIPALTYFISGFVNNDMASVVSGAPVLGTSATASSLPGIYPISIAIGTLSAVNYSFSLMGGTVTLTLPVEPGKCVPFPVTLAAPAGPNGAVVTLTSSDSTIVDFRPGVNPVMVTIPAGATSPQKPPQVCGVQFGTATVSASPGVTNTSQVVVVQVTATLSFARTNVMMTTANEAHVELLLTALAPAGGLTVNLSSDNAAVATVPTTVIIPANLRSVIVPVTGVAAGSTTIHANALPNAPDTTTIVIVQ